MIFYFIRHGDPVYEPDSLTPLGIRQAEALAKRLSRFELDEIFVSSSNRAVQTATPTCNMLHKEMKILDWCNEKYAWNDFAYTDEKGNASWTFQKPEIRKLFVSNEISQLGKAWYKHTRFAEKNFEHGVKRVEMECDALLATLGYEHNRENNTYFCVNKNHKRVALFAHQGFGMIFLSSLLDIPYPTFCTHFDLGHSSMTVIEFAPEKGTVIPTAIQLGNDSHIYSDGLPTKHQNKFYV